ncbi:MAG: hypothetical protein OHK0037_20460 [Elainellaceae cyanobacterium]
MEDRFNPFGLLILLAFGGAAFDVIQQALDKQGKALYLPSFAPPTEDFPNVGVLNSAKLPVPTPPLYPAGSDLPPPPIAHDWPVAAAPPLAAAGEQVLTVSRENLAVLLQASGGMQPDGCLNQPVIMDGMIGRDRVVADMEWSPGQKIVFAIDPSNGAVKCLEFAFDREAPQW